MKKIFLIIVLLLINLNVVKAITLNEIKDKINETALNVKASVSNNELIINDHDNELIFNLEDNILSRTDSYKKNTLDSVNDLYIYLNLTKVVALLKGYQNKEIEYFLISLEDAKLNNDGYEIIKRKTNDDIELTYKIDLNNFKINFNYIDAPAPVISIIDTKDEIVTLLINLEEDGEVDLYRSTDNKNYEYVNTITVNNGNAIYYNKVDSNNTYYYKAVVKMANNYSEVVEVNFPKEKKDNNYLDEKTENPLTGYQEFVAISLLIIIAILGIIGNINLKRKVYR